MVLQPHDLCPEIGVVDVDFVRCIGDKRRLAKRRAALRIDRDHLRILL